MKKIVKAAGKKDNAEVPTKNSKGGASAKAKKVKAAAKPSATNNPRKSNIIATSNFKSSKISVKVERLVSPNINSIKLIQSENDRNKYLLFNLKNKLTCLLVNDLNTQSSK